MKHHVCGMTPGAQRDMPQGHPWHARLSTSHTCHPHRRVVAPAARSGLAPSRWCWVQLRAILVPSPVGVSCIMVNASIGRLRKITWNGTRTPVLERSKLEKCSKSFMTDWDSSARCTSRFGAAPCHGRARRARHTAHSPAHAPQPTMTTRLEYTYMVADPTHPSLHSTLVSLHSAQGSPTNHRSQAPLALLALARASSSAMDGPEPERAELCFRTFFAWVVVHQTQSQNDNSSG